MKVKLLKKVRKRYSIIEVTKVDKYPDDFTQVYLKEFGLPFFEIRDKECISEYSVRNVTAAKTKKIALEVIKKWIRQDYKDKMPNKKGTKKKIWWNNN